MIADAGKLAKGAEVATLCKHLKSCRSPVEAVRMYSFEYDARSLLHHTSVQCLGTKRRHATMLQNTQHP